MQREEVMPQLSVGVASPASAPRRGLPFGRIALVVVGLVVLVALGRQAGSYIPQFAQWVNGLGVWGPIVFILGYAVAAVAFVPGSLLTLAAGAIFGLAQGVVYVFIAAVLGSSAAFLVSRYLARRAIERRLASNPRFAAIDRAVGAQGRKIVFLLRLSPVFPFNLLNYGLGLTKVTFRRLRGGIGRHAAGDVAVRVLRQAGWRCRSACGRGGARERCRLLRGADPRFGSHRRSHNVGNTDGAPRAQGGDR